MSFCNLIMFRDADKLRWFVRCATRYLRLDARGRVKYQPTARLTRNLSRPPCTRADIRYAEKYISGYVCGPPLYARSNPPPLSIECLLYLSEYNPIDGVYEYQYVDCVWLAYDCVEYGSVHVLVDACAEVDRIVAALVRDRRCRLR